MQIIAHRGASAYEQENTIAAFQKAQELGSTFFETDVQMTKDGVLALWHDYDVRGRAIKTHTLAELQIAKLEDLLAILRPGDALNIEIKNDGNIYRRIEEKILNLLPLRLKNRILISSFDYPTLKRVRALDKQIKIGLLTRDFDVKQALEIKAYSVNISLKRATKETAEICRKNNLKLFVYTVNTAREAIAMKALGADGVFSDYPDLKIN